MTENRRQDDRLPVLWQAVLIDEQDEKYPCQIRDISLAGALITCEADFDLNTDLLVEIDGLGEFAGRVRWAGNNAIGLLLIAGDDLELKKFAQGAGAELSRMPQSLDDE